MSENLALTTNSVSANTEVFIFGQFEDGEWFLSRARAGEIFEPMEYGIGILGLTTMQLPVVKNRELKDVLLLANTTLNIPQLVEVLQLRGLNLVVTNDSENNG